MPVKQQKIIVVDPDRCVGCHSCEMACSVQHFSVCSPQHSRIRIQEFREVNTFIPIVCQCCEDAPCIKVCPSNARLRNENGSVVTDDDKCVGCHMCIYACPFAAVVTNPETGKTMSCDQCNDHELGPWCVKSCTMQKALQFVDVLNVAQAKGREYARKIKEEYKPADDDDRSFGFSFSVE